ncbi:F0F1 ATP synthase subunit delta [Candidatus Uhrbacteria bacterium]|nr:F0F1 ATP synthase subunit delta [Candidatus Uhrbacteria bacterium]
MARMVVRSCRDLSDKEARAAVARFVAAAGKKLGAAAVRDIAAAIPEAWNAEEGIAKALVRSARPLSDAEVSSLLVALGADAKKTDVNLEIDPSLVGGALVRTHDRLLDATIKTRVNMLAKRGWQGLGPPRRAGQ